MSTVWLNATETEVYAIAFLFGCMMLWAADRAGENSDARWALLAAYLAGLKAGVCPDLDGFAATWRLDRRFEPRMDDATRERKWSGWQDAVRRTLTRR